MDIEGVLRAHRRLMRVETIRDRASKARAEAIREVVECNPHGVKTEIARAIGVSVQCVAKLAKRAADG